MAILHGHPGGLPLDTVAAELGVAEKVLRKEILGDLRHGSSGTPSWGLTRADTIESLAADGVEADPHQAPIIRAVSDRPEAELGVEYLRRRRVRGAVRSGLGLAELEPGQRATGSGRRRTSGHLPGRAHQVHHSGADAVGEGTAAVLRRAVEQRSVVRIRYSRAWRPGVGSADIQPLRTAPHRPRLGGRRRTSCRRRRASVHRRADQAAEVLPAHIRSPRAHGRTPGARPRPRVGRVVHAATVPVGGRPVRRIDRRPDQRCDRPCRCGRSYRPVAERVGLILVIADRPMRSWCRHRITRRPSPMSPAHCWPTTDRRTRRSDHGHLLVTGRCRCDPGPRVLRPSCGAVGLCRVGAGAYPPEVPTWATSSEGYVSGPGPLDLSTDFAGRSRTSFPRGRRRAATACRCVRLGAVGHRHGYVDPAQPGYL